MQKIGHSTPTANAEGEFSEGNPSAGVEPTWLTAKWHNSIQRELIAVVQGAGLVLDPARDNQLLDALKILNRLTMGAPATGGSANAQTVNFAPAPTAYTSGMIIAVLASYSNTGPLTINVNSLGPVPVLGSVGALQGGEFVFGGNYLLQYSGGKGGFALIGQAGGSVQTAPAQKSQHAVPLGQAQGMFSGIVGSMRNAKMSVATASATGTFTADEIIVESAIGGQTYRLVNFNNAINLALSGAGGMDTGAAPASGFLSIYAIYNPTTQTSALLACSQAVSSGLVYTGPNMPSGYTASGLVSAWGTTAAGLLVAGLQIERQINVALTNINSSSINQSNTPISIAAIAPLAAKEIAGLLQCGSSSTSNVTMSLSGAAFGVGARNLGATVAAGTVVQGAFSGLSLGTPSTVYYTASAVTGALSSTAYLSSYTI